MNSSGLSIESWKKEIAYKLIWGSTQCLKVASLGHGRGWGVGVGMAEGCASSHQRWKLFPLTLHGVAPYRTPASLNIIMQKGYSIFPRPSSKHLPMQAVPSWTTNPSTCMLLFGFIGKHITHTGIMITQPQKVPSHPHCYIMASWTTKSNLSTLFGFQLISS